MSLTPYWVDRGDELYGLGVTATSPEGALELLNDAGFEVPSGEFNIREIASVAELDQDHVVPNMGLLVRSGVWYPNLNS